MADVALATFFRNAAFAGYTIDAARWPATARFVAHAFDHPSFAKLRAFEELSARTPLPEQRDALIAAGAPIMAQTLGTSSPRRGVLAT
jgi:glutathione S-transferase